MAFYSSYKHTYKRIIVFLIALFVCFPVLAQNRVHTVGRGETLATISAKYGVSESSLTEANPRVKSYFYVGMKLSIPDSKPVDDSKSSSATTTSSAATASSTTATAVSTSAAETKPSAAQTSSPPVRMSGGSVDYNRSSLCLIMLSHKGGTYASEMKSQFEKIVLPSRYNEHNISLHVLDVSGHQSKKDVSKLMAEHNVARDVVGRWFNRSSYSGKMDMNLVHSRGAYNAQYQDIRRAQATVRGLNLLSEEGVELLDNTFVLVCDMDYIDKEKGAKVASELLGAASAFAGGMARYYSSRGNYTSSTYAQLGELATAAGSAVTSDVGGFAVMLKAHLFKLKWNKNAQDKLFGEYWVDGDTPSSEANERKRAFEKDRSTFQLEYLGSHEESSGKTVFISQNNLYQVIRDVCSTTIDKSITALAKNYPVFRPKTSFYTQNGSLYAYIGTKESVNMWSKYEIVESKLKNDGSLSYRRVSTVEPVSVWNNTSVSPSDYVSGKYKGTKFSVRGGTSNLDGKGYLLRERCKPSYQYKRHTFSIDISYVMGQTEVKYGKSGSKFVSWTAVSPRLRYTQNYNEHFAWNVISVFGMFGPESGAGLGADTGFIARTSPLTDSGLFTVYGTLDLSAYFYGNDNISSSKAKWYDLRAGAGTDISKHWYLQANYGFFSRMVHLTLGFNF